MTPYQRRLRFAPGRPRDTSPRGRKGLLSALAPENIAQAREQVITRVRESMDGSGVSFKIMHSDILVGIIAIRSINWTHKKCIVGYFLDRNWTNKRIATRCLNKVVEICFELLNLNRIAAHTSILNNSSNKLLEKVGFKKEGTLRQDFFIGGKFVDDNAYAILKIDWEN